MKNSELEKIYNFLSENDYIKPGNLIDSEVLSGLFRSEVDSIEYVGDMILLEKHIQQKTGLFCKSVESCIYIMTADEGIKATQNRLKKSERIKQEIYNTITKTDVKEFSCEKKRQEHSHNINLVFMLNRTSRLIIQDNRFKKD